MVYLGHLDSFLTGFSASSFLPSLSHANCLAGEIFLPTVLAHSPIQIIHARPGPTRGPYSLATLHPSHTIYPVSNHKLHSAQLSLGPMPPPPPPPLEPGALAKLLAPEPKLFFPLLLCHYSSDCPISLPARLRVAPCLPV